MFGIWPVYTGRALGIAVDGDPSVPPTRWWNHFRLLLVGWKKVVVFEADTLHVYRIGYIPQSGDARICPRPLTGKVAVRIGREPCTFFAETTEGREVLLEISCRTQKRHLAKEIPLV